MSKKTLHNPKFDPTLITRQNAKAMNFGAIYGMNNSMDRLAKAFKPCAKAISDMGKSISEMSRVLAKVIAKVDDYAKGIYIPETDEERLFLDTFIVADIMES